MKSISWIGCSQIASLVLQFAGSVVLARFLTPYEMGIYAVAGATVALLALISALGLQNLIVRDERLDEATLTSAFTVNAAMAIALSVLIVGASYVGGTALGDDRVRHVIFALSISPLFSIFDFLPSARLERAGRFRDLALSSTAASVVAAVVTIASALLGANYMSAVYAGWASAATNAILINIAGRQFISFRFGVKHWRRVAEFGLQMLATSGLHSVGARLSDLCLAKLQGLGSLGIYNRASNLNGLIWNNVHMAAGRVLFVDFAALHRQGVNLRERYILVVDLMTALLWPAFAGFAVLSGPIIQLIYGHRWVVAAAPMALLSLSSIVLVSMTMTWEIFTATGNIRTQTKIEFYNAAMITAIFVVGCYFGLIWAAASRVLSALISVIIYRPHMNRMTNTNFSDFSLIYAKNGLLTLVAISPALLAMSLHRFSPDTPIILVASSVLAGAAVWVSALLLTRHRLVVELIGMLQRRSRATA